MYPLLQGKAKHFQKVASYSSNAVFTSPIVTSSVTRLLDDVFAGTGDEGELIGDMALYLLLYERALEVLLFRAVHFASIATRKSETGLLQTR